MHEEDVRTELSRFAQRELPATRLRADRIIHLAHRRRRNRRTVGMLLSGGMTAAVIILIAVVLPGGSDDGRSPIPAGPVPSEERPVPSSIERQDREPPSDAEDETEADLSPPEAPPNLPMPPAGPGAALP